jgi:hypothetical protein
MLYKGITGPWVRVRIPHAAMKYCRAGGAGGGLPGGGRAAYRYTMSNIKPQMSAGLSSIGLISLMSRKRD